MIDARQNINSTERPLFLLENSDLVIKDSYFKEFFWIGDLFLFITENNNSHIVNNSVFENISCNNLFLTKFSQTKNGGEIIIISSSFFHISVKIQIFKVVNMLEFCMENTLINGSIGGGSIKLVNIIKKNFKNVTISYFHSQNTAFGIKIIDGVKNQLFEQVKKK